MFGIFRKRAGKLSADLEALEKQAARLVVRAEAHINSAKRVMNILADQVDEAEAVIELVRGLPQTLKNNRG